MTSQTETRIPWYIWCATLAVTSVIIGAHWDISWHTSIGRDTFWTPAHGAIYLCGVLAGIAFGYLILHTTFVKSSPLGDASIHVFGFRAPLGAFIASWGGIAMLTSAPFDNWWHDAYGLDVKIVSPPHVLLFLGVYGVTFGTAVLLAGHMNRASGKDREALRWLFLYVCGIMLTMTMVILMEYTERSALHGSLVYILLSALPPIVMTLGSRATGFRFAATSIAGFYMLFNIGLILLLPLFPAEPKLGPVYQHVTHFIPPQFPMLLVAPALVLDLLWQRTKEWNAWKTALVSGALYVLVLLAVEWPFANFLMSPASRNRFFGTTYFYYAAPPSSFLVRSLFYPFQGTASFWEGILFAIVLGTLAIRWGISRGQFLARIKR
jgi:hypothetical protein